MATTADAVSVWWQVVVCVAIRAGVCVLSEMYARRDMAPAETVTVIKLDYDGRLPRRWLAWVTQVVRYCGARCDGAGLSRSRRGWHGELVVSGWWTPAEVTALQAVLGSDPRRELCNLVRVRALKRMTPAGRRYWGTRWNVLFAEKLQRRRGTT